VDGEKKKGERLLRPLRKYLRPFEDTIEPKAYLDEQRGGFDVPEESIQVIDERAISRGSQTTLSRPSSNTLRMRRMKRAV